MMEVRVSSEQGVMAAGREPFGLPKSPPVPPSSAGPLQSVRMAYTADGTPVFAPVSSAPPPTAKYQPVGGGGHAAGPKAAAAGGNGSAAAPPLDSSGEPPHKKKRGRPRKYGPDGSMSLALVPVAGSPASATPGAPGPFSPAAAVKAGDTMPSASPPDGVKKRGRPKGSTNKKHVPGFAGGGLTPHVIFVKAGEDVSAKIMSFAHQDRGVCMLSANGAISNVTLRQAASSGGTVTYEGRFEILSLSGSFIPSDDGGHRSRTGGLSVSLASPDGRVLGGCVAGLLTAASPVQIVVGSFFVDGLKEPKHQPLVDLASAPAKVAPISGMGPNSPPSRGTLSESSGGPGSPLNQGATASNHSQPAMVTGISWK